jgi:dTDP-4-dehydrorhamnose reductase
MTNDTNYNNTRPTAIFIIGKGYVGSYLLKHLNIKNYKCVNIARSIYSDSKLLQKYLKYVSSPGDVVINCAGYIGTNSIKDCEDDIDLTHEVNSNLPCNILFDCCAYKLRFIHISTGGLFQCQNNFNGGYIEDDIPNNTSSAYYFSKYLAELSLNGINKRRPWCALTIVRIHMPISEDNHPHNLACKLIKYDTLINNTNTITPLCDLVCGLESIIQQHLYGTYNIVNPAPISNKTIHDILTNDINKNTTPGIHESILSSSKIDKKSGQRVFCNLSDHLCVVGEALRQQCLT